VSEADDDSTSVVRKPGEGIVALPRSTAMAICLAQTIEHGGRLIHHRGGCWTWPDCPRAPHSGIPETYFGAATIQALVTLGRMAYVEWEEGKSGRFPIVAAIVVDI
jgi:hypothetical protein